MYPAMYEKTLLDRIDLLSDRIDKLLSDPESPLLSKISASRKELYELEGAVLTLQNRIVGENKRSLVSEIKAGMNQIRKLLEI